MGDDLVRAAGDDLLGRLEDQPHRRCRGRASVLVRREREPGAEQRAACGRRARRRGRSRRGPRPTAGRSVQRRAARPGPRAGPRGTPRPGPEVGDQAGAGQRAHADARRPRAGGDERRRARLGAGELGVRVQVASYLHQLPRQPVHRRAQGVGEQGGVHKTCRLPSRRRPSTGAPPAGADGAPPTAAQVRPARPLLFSSLDEGLDLLAPGPGWSPAPRPGCRPRRRRPARAPRRCGPTPGRPARGRRAARTWSRDAQDLHPGQVVAVGDQGAEGGEVAHVVPVEVAGDHRDPSVGGGRLGHRVVDRDLRQPRPHAPSQPRPGVRRASARRPAASSGW